MSIDYIVDRRPQGYDSSLHPQIKLQFVDPKHAHQNKAEPKTSNTKSIQEQFTSRSDFKMLNFAAFLFVVFNSPAASTPVPGSDEVWKFPAVIDEFNATRVNLLQNTLSPREVRPQSHLIKDVGCEINNGYYGGWNFCVVNYKDPTQCTLSFWDRKGDPSPRVWLFNNNCELLGQEDHASRTELATEHGYNFASKLKHYIVIHYNGNGTGNNKDVHWWYAGRYTNPKEGDLWKKWQNGYTKIYGSGDDYLYRFAYDC